VTSGLFYHKYPRPVQSAIPDSPGYQGRVRLALPARSDLSRIRQANLREYAAYGEASYAFDGGWKVTVGARAFKVDQTFYQRAMAC